MLSTLDLAPYVGVFATAGLLIDIQMGSVTVTGDVFKIPMITVHPNLFTNHFLDFLILHHNASQIRIFRDIRARFRLSFLSVSSSFYTSLFLSSYLVNLSYRRRKLVSGIPIQHQHSD